MIHLHKLGTFALGLTTSLAAQQFDATVEVGFFNSVRASTGTHGASQFITPGSLATGANESLRAVSPPPPATALAEASMTLQSSRSLGRYQMSLASMVRAQPTGSITVSSANAGTDEFRVRLSLPAIDAELRMRITSVQSGAFSSGLARASIDVFDDGVIDLVNDPIPAWVVFPLPSNGAARVVDVRISTLATVQNRGSASNLIELELTAANATTTPLTTLGSTCGPAQFFATPSLDGAVVLENMLPSQIAIIVGFATLAPPVPLPQAPISGCSLVVRNDASVLMPPGGSLALGQPNPAGLPLTAFIQGISFNPAVGFESPGAWEIRFR